MPQLLFYYWILPPLAVLRPMEGQACHEPPIDFALATLYWKVR